MTHLNEIQITTLLRLAESRPRDHALLSMSAYTALRITDILSLNVSSILDDYGRMRHRLTLRPKRSSRRLEIPLPEPLRKSLRRYLDSRVIADREEPLFMNLDRSIHHGRKSGSRRLTRHGAHSLFKSYLAQALGVGRKEIRGLSTHALRRSLALMIYNRHGLRAAQEMLGHENISSTGAYLDKLLASTQAEVFRDELNFTPRNLSKTESRQ